MYSDEQTEKELSKLEKKIKKVYNKAYKELDEKVKKYFESFAKRDAEMRAAIGDGSYPIPAGWTAHAYYKQWRKNQIGRGERWIKLRDDIAQRIGKANEQAAACINDSTPSIYALNYNYEAYQIEGIAGGAWDIYDENTVKSLVKGDNHVEFRTVSVNPVRDYAWNKEKIDAELLSGILQGKSISGLADGYMNVMGNNRKAAIRNARTSVTSAQNGGRQEGFRKAEAMGIEVKKRWMSAQDSRVRDSHAHLDGVMVKQDEKFPNGLMYPGDPSGAPAEVYNCRCTMVGILPKYNKDLHDTGNTVESYKEWLKEKREFAETSNKGLSKDYSINKDLIYSNKFKNVVNSLGEDKVTSKKIVEAMRTTLEHRNGTLYEDLTFIDGNTHQSISRRDYNVERECMPSKAMKQMAKKSNNIIAIHNHPSSTPPSYADLRTCKNRRYKYGLIACHNGKIYKYSATGEVNAAEYELLFSTLINSEQNEKDIKAFTENAKRINANIEVV